MSYIFVPSAREERLTGKKIIIILEHGCLELVEHPKKKTIGLLNSIQHRTLLKKASRPYEDARPDIVHRCLLMLQDSPLNLSGHLALFIRTADSQLIEISPQLSVPQHYNDFESLMVTLLMKKNIKARHSNVTLMKFVKNDLPEILPPECRQFGFSVNGEAVDLTDFCKQFGDTKNPLVFFIGAVAKADPASKKYLPSIEKDIQISSIPLTAATCCSKLCSEFEYVWGIN